MSVHAWKRAAVLLPLLALLVAVPYRLPAAQASPAASNAQAVAGAATDAALVRASFEHPIQDSQFYFVLPDRFDNAEPSNDRGGYGSGDTDADVLRHGYQPRDKGYYHGGDFNGLLAKLPYLQALGINAIWMTPIFKNRPVQCGAESTIAACSAGYHGYWITDFTQVDPHLGTNAELTALVRAAHARGMKVFFDIITNHTADVIDYEEREYSYRNKRNFPYRDADGNVFDDRDYAGTNSFPPLDVEESFPYTPVFRTPQDADVKEPDWLDDRRYYHNRGNSTFSGESSEYGDFVGLDDLWTEHPQVVDGMTEIYKTWVTDFGIDGYRIDTVKHVNMEFWQKFSPGILEYARSHGREDFFMYGEVFDGNPSFVSRYTTAGKLQAALDFPFQGTAVGFASQSQPTDNLRDLFANDDYYIDADSNAYQLPTFLGNHDMGRFGHFLQRDNADAGDQELLARARLGHALMYLARGMPVVYYGDEQGFTGDGGDKDARQDMMASLVSSYNDDDLIGTNATTAQANFDTTHPLFQTLARLSELRQAHDALRYGAQITRYSTGQAGIFAFSRIDRDELFEYVVAVNNAESEQSATFKTYHANGTFQAVYPTAGGSLTSDANANLTLTVPPLGFVVYRANRTLPAMAQAPGISITTPETGAEVTGRIEIAAQLDSDRFAEVSFGVKVGDATTYTYIGTDNNPLGPGQPIYRVFYDLSQHPVGTPISFKAVANDPTDDNEYGSGALASASVDVVVGEEDVCVSNPSYAIIHYNRPAGDYEGWGLHLWGDAIDPSEATEWTSPKLPNGEDEYGVFWYIKLADASQPLNFIVHKGDEKDTPNDRSFLPTVATSGQVWLKQGDANAYMTRAAVDNVAIIHYHRDDGDYGNPASSNFQDFWGLHVWTGAATPTEWTSPIKPAGQDRFGVYFRVPLAEGATELAYILHRGDTKDLPEDQLLDLAAVGNEVWIINATPGYLLPTSTNCAVSNAPSAREHRIFLSLVSQAVRPQRTR